ncbi:hypothetical protein HS088_TW13G00898 [Tripterygium wilfordii]|uniref:WEB family protein n=1 Tax=Tripterygium wilfordii TaxID=458696 RepID=A0A7J7CV49_TRIWF|nr:WEB family protein At5g16730, chloroplastic-like [Tripterygium wilfordii]XP_038720862.1 WEB family protein At5g16730, chloroplastic-like [Tripterygium wilfordii]KAF5738005.1 hypothetical protein HS088_TW13G00898 [Tripterygium wilfordii]
MTQIDEELMKMKERLGVAEEERDRALGQLGEIKEVTEANSLKELLSNMAQQLKEKDALLEKLKEELSNFKATDACQSDLSLRSDNRIQELEADVDKWKNSETKLLVSFAAQTKQLEQTKISLEESKLEISSLQEKVKKSSGQKSNDLHPSMKDLRPSMKEALESFKSELQTAKQILVQAKEGEKLALSKAASLLKEMDLLKQELKIATEAEEISKKAMDDLAMALKEVATKAKQVNEKRTSTQEEVENLKSKLKSTEDEYKTRLDEVRKDADRFRNTSERLRLEAEETLLAWNEKETGFVNCIKRVEEEKASLIEENNTLLQALTGAENLTRKAKDENHKLRDILKQALNESNVAKEAAAIARAENSQLKDVLAEKDDALDFIIRENENLRVNEASALENIKDLKRLLAESSPKDSKPGEKDKEQGSKANQQQQKSQGKGKKDNKEHKEQKDSEEHKDDKEHKDIKNTIWKTISFNLKDLKIQTHKEAVDDEHQKTQTKHKAEEPQDEGDDEATPETDDMMKGSIFDMAETPVSNTEHHRKKSSSTFTFTVDGETLSSEDLEHLEGTHCDDENDRNSRKKRALLRRFGDILRRRSFH